MYLILKVQGKSIQVWPLQFPTVSQFATAEEKFNIREKYIKDQVLLAKIEHAALIEKETDWQLYIEIKASVQPKNVGERIGKPVLKFVSVAPVIEMVRFPAVYSNSKSLYK